MIIAYHGFGGSAQMLREDIGDIGLEIYFSEAKTLRQARRELIYLGIPNPSWAAIGYSRGVKYISDITCLYSNTFRRVVLYEGPLGKFGTAGGTADALIIWNDQGRGDTQAAAKMEEAWARGGRHVEHLQGVGEHIRKDPELGPRHGWDQALNPQIAQFLKGE
jgi:hypothetical protein